jgi:hypothetical protein
MSNKIVDINGQSVTTESPTCTSNPTPAAAPAAPAPRPSLSPEEMQRIIGAYARLKQLGDSKIINPRDEAERTGLQNFLTGALLTHCEELFGCWVAMHNEYTPLITGFTALVGRALNRIDQQTKANAAAPVTEKV